MRRAHVHMSWSDSMASSMTVTGSRSLVVRQHGNSRLARNPPRVSEHDQTLRRLVQELSASRIEEEPEEEELSGQSPPAPLRNHRSANSNREQRVVRGETRELETAALESSAPETLSRRKRVARAIKANVSRLLHLIAYYLRRAMEEYAASASVYRPLQYTMY
ncbi:hypothetical protein IWW52_004143 [Coemansia sp. RSA 2704]|nr:hypothetical protein IWW52_004143 [Coemansia sp. RSA 2704]